MYKKLLNFPKLILLGLIVILLGSLYFSKNFKLDASADTLLLENDPDLKYLREVNERYGSEEFFILTYEPKATINKDSILELEKFVTKINELKWVSKTISIINAPLLHSSNEPLMERIQNLKYITSPNIDFETAIKELTSSPIYKNLIISEDSKTFGIVVYLKENKKYLDLISKKSRLLENNNPDESVLVNLKSTNENLDMEKKIQGDLTSSYNQEIKNLIAEQNQSATIRLSGIPMIADDMITFIKNDIVIFGFGVFAFIIFILWMVFRNLKWVAFPLINCFSSILIMVGFLGALQWKVTVISSNFIALMLILTISMNIHYLVRYIQIKNENENATPIDLVVKTSSNIFYPIFYAVLTTICAFMSLVFSDIKPVMDFGWMMTYGLLVSFALSFLLLPSLILIFNPKVSVQIKEKKSKFAELLAYISTQFPKLIYSLSVFLIVFSINGISKLKVENSFINYFSSKTEIYKGMKNIDEKLGGTTPLEIILKFKNQGFNNFYISINYLGHMIKNYLGNGDKLGVKINYINENKFLGTIGCLSLLNKEFLKSKNIIIINGDIITDLNFYELLQYHLSNRSFATVVCRNREISYPFGVVVYKGKNLVSFKEKPIYNNLINAGIYCLRTDSKKFITKNKKTDMPDFLLKLKKSNKRILVYPIIEEWSDVGNIEVFNNFNKYK